ncbi:hypothetical protein GCM10023317_21070 [Actinopolymorpha pittospori]
MSRVWPTVRIMALLIFVVVGTGCGATAVREDAARKAAEGFHAAVGDRDAARACGLLAPATREDLEHSAGEGCSKAIMSARIRSAGAVGHIDVYGDQARVVFAHDTVFLSAFSAGWRITAAGCHPRGERPYQCELRGD